MSDKKGKRSFPQLEFVVIEDEPAPARVIIRPAGAPSTKASGRGKQRAEPVEVITIDDQPQPGPANDKRTKQELLALIAKYEAERKTFQRRLESNEEYLQRELHIDSVENVRIYKISQTERDEARAELAEVKAELAEAKAELDLTPDERYKKARAEIVRLRARDERHKVIILDMRDTLRSLRDDGYQVAPVEDSLQALQDRLQADMASDQA